jgi:hypothetical protein
MGLLDETPAKPGGFAVLGPVSVALQESPPETSSAKIVTGLSQRRGERGPRCGRRIHTVTSADPVGRLTHRDPYDLVHCPACDRRATIRYDPPDTRLTCGCCGYAKAGLSVPDARLWLETECCGGHRLWAWNERHLDYIERFVTSKDRDREFPSPPGARQLSDKFPAWLVSRKHRDEVTRAIHRLRSTL